MMFLHRSHLSISILLFFYLPICLTYFRLLLLINHHTHTHTHTLSLSHTHTRTHTHTPVCLHLPHRSHPPPNLHTHIERKHPRLPHTYTHIEKRQHNKHDRHTFTAAYAHMNDICIQPTSTHIISISSGPLCSPFICSLSQFLTVSSSLCLIL